MLYCLREAGFHYRDLMFYNVLSLTIRMYISDLMNSKSEFRCSGPGSFSGRGGY